MTEIRKFYPPDFTKEELQKAPDCKVDFNNTKENVIYVKN